MNFKKIFLCGSKTIGHIPDAVAHYLTLFMKENVWFLIGDCHGADWAIQTYLHEKEYKNVTVYCTGDKCRFNMGNWTVKHIPVNDGVSGYFFY